MKHNVRHVFFALLVLLWGLVPTTGSPAAHEAADLPPAGAYQDAIGLIRQERFEEALPRLAQARREQPENVFILADQVCCLAWTGRHQQAVETYERNVSVLSGIAYAEKAAAQACYRLGRFDQARALYEKLLHASPGDAESFKGIVYTLSAVGDRAAARRHISQARTRGIFPAAVLDLLEADMLRQDGREIDAYIGYIRTLESARSEKLIHEAQNSRREIAGMLAGQDFQDLALRFPSGSPVWIVSRIDAGRHSALPARADLPQHLPPGLLLELGWGYFKAGRHTEALDAINEILARQPEAGMAHVVRAYPLAAQGEFAAARQSLRDAESRDVFPLKVLFARAFVQEQQRDFLAALDTYETILRRFPGNATARQLWLRCLADLGAPSLAKEALHEPSPVGQQLVDDIHTNMAVNRIRWSHKQAACQGLEEVLQHSPANVRARGDYVVALRSANMMPETLAQYRQLSGRTPSYVIQSAADASLYLEETEQALKLYEATLEREPEYPLQALLGRVYCLQELRRWRQADRAWKQLDDYLAAHPRGIDVWDRLEAHLAHGWYRAYRDDLQGAQGFFTGFLQDAGMNSTCRSALSYVSLWRGWPRRALQEFRIAQQLDFKAFDPGIQTGLAKTLNALNRKSEARALAGTLSRTYPRDRSVLELVEELMVEDMNEVFLEGRFVSESPGADEYWLRASLTEPLTPEVRIFQEILWQEVSESSDRFEWNRVGLGCEWIVAPELLWRQAVSFDYDDRDEFGYLSELVWQPTDHIRLMTGLNTYRLDIPLRARAAGLDGESFYVDAMYRQSELRHVGAALDLNWLDDGNRGSGATLYYDQSLWNGADVKLRGGFRFGYWTNSRQDVDYFSPKKGFTFQLTQTLHVLHLSRHDKRFRSSLYAREGFYSQHRYATEAIYGLTYEQTIDFSKKTALVWNTAWDRKIYDGDSTHVWSGYFGFRQSF